MTRKKLVIIIVCAAMLLALCIVGGYYAILFMKHPAFTHNDYVYGNKLVIDNETPFEYDAELADQNPYKYPTRNSTLDQVQYYFGNKILREKDGYLYTVYSSPDNNLLYIFFTKNNEGTWVLSHDTLTNMAYIHDDLMQEIYEYDAPRCILGDALPTETISAYFASRATESATSYLSNIRYILGIPDIRHLVADGTYAQAYRMTFEGVYHGVQYIDFYVNHDGTGTIIYRRYNSSEIINIKGLFENVTYELTVEETAGLVKIWEDQEFQWLPCTHPYEADSISDGYKIYLEGINGCNKYPSGETIYSWYYNMTHLHDDSVNYTELFTIRNAMIATVESKGTEVRFNMTHQEEELRANQNN